MLIIFKAFTGLLMLLLTKSVLHVVSEFNKYINKDNSLLYKTIALICATIILILIEQKGIAFFSYIVGDIIVYRILHKKDTKIEDEIFHYTISSIGLIFAIIYIFI